MTASLLEQLADLPKAEADALIRAMARGEANAFEYHWRYRARPEQLPPGGSWRVWLLMAGRGFGKTRCGAEWVRAEVKAGRRRIALVGATAVDARDVMVEGEAGILAISPDHERPLYEPSKRRLTWRNGAVATTFSADEPERLRGPQHDAAWCDELGAWRYPEAWDMLMFGMRLGADPRTVVTTTPRPAKLIRDLVRDPTCVVTRGSSYENRANLAGAFLQQIIKKYEGTRLGRQELNAELLDDVPGALWSRALIEAARPPMGFVMPDLVRVVVAIDPAANSGADADETGIIVAGKDKDSRGYVLADLSGHHTPIEWARIAVDAYKSHGADRIVAEVNNGGEMVEATLRVVDDNVAYTAVHATRGKVELRDDLLRVGGRQIMRAREVPVLQHECNIALESLMKSGFFERQAEQSSLAYRFEGEILTEASKSVAQLRRGNRGPRRATQPLVLPRLSAISAPCTSACRVQKRRVRVIVGVGRDVPGADISPRRLAANRNN